MTRQCPFECRHCYFCGGPNGETMTTLQAKSVVDHLPDNVETIGISGGEPFTNTKLLKSILGFIKDRNFPDLTRTTVQTVGFWARDRERVKRTLDELIKLGANSFYIYGNDDWHREQGLKPECQELLIDVLIEEFGAYKPGKMEEIESIFTKDGITYSHKKTGRILPIGRASWATTEDEWMEKSKRPPVCPGRDFLDLHPDGYIYMINFNGEVHFCNWKSGPYLGNIFDLPLAQILEEARKRKILQVMNEGDISKLASEICGIPKQDATREIDQRGMCVYCNEILGAYLANSDEEPIIHSIWRREREKAK
ncbi:MAG: radical SAM protein [Candidatus Electryoneaceae bacterium]|nr:radical SAM protein [Candidatus Electryoneaceae bacterium]